MKLIYALTITVLCCLSVMAQESDALSKDEELLKLLMEIEHLKADLKKSEEYLEKVMIEKERISNLTDSNIQDNIRLYISIFTSAVVLIGFLVNFFGKQAIQRYINNQVIKVTQTKVDEALTPEFLQQEVRLKAEQPMQDAVNQLQTEIKELIEKSIKEERNRFQQKGEELLESQREELRVLLKSNRLELSEESKQKVENFEKTLESTKDQSEFSSEDWYLKGLAEQKREDHHNAIQSFSKSIELSKDHYWSWYYRGLSKHDINDLDGASEDFDHAIKIEPEISFAWYARGQINFELKKLDGALKDFSQAIKMNSEFFLNWAQRAEIYVQLGKKEDALEDYNRAISLITEDDLKTASWILLDRGNVNLDLKNYQQAIEDYSLVITNDHENYKAYWKRGRAKNMLGKYEDAIEDLSQDADSIYSQQADRAYSYFNMGNTEAAEKDIQSFEEFSFEQSGWYYIGLIRQKQDRMKEACEAWKKAADSGFEEAQEMLDKYCPDS